MGKRIKDEEKVKGICTRIINQLQTLDRWNVRKQRMEFRKKNIYRYQNANRTNSKTQHEDQCFPLKAEQWFPFLAQTFLQLRRIKMYPQFFIPIAKGENEK
jgi:hypothetical protein